MTVHDCILIALCRYMKKAIRIYQQSIKQEALFTCAHVHAHTHTYSFLQVHYNKLASRCSFPTQPIIHGSLRSELCFGPFESSPSTLPSPELLPVAALQMCTLFLDSCTRQLSVVGPTQNLFQKPRLFPCCSFGLLLLAEILSVIVTFLLVLEHGI